MTEDANQITADHLRAEFLNASTNWQRWKVLNKALDWAVTASENAAAARERAAEMKARVEGAAVEKAAKTEGLHKGDRVYWTASCSPSDGDGDYWYVHGINEDGAVEIARTPEAQPFQVYGVHPMELTRAEQP